MATALSARLLPVLLRGELWCLSLQVFPVTSTRDSFPHLPTSSCHTTISSLAFPPRSQATAISSLLPPPQLRNLFLSRSPPPPPTLPSLVSASLWFSPSWILCYLCLLFVHLSVLLCTCLMCSSVSRPLQILVCLSVSCVSLSLLSTRN